MHALTRPALKHFSALLLSFFCLAAVAQSPASKPETDGIDHITLGQSVFPLNGPWKFSIGDSPLDPVTHQPLWAEPGFDDSHWENVDLTPPEGSFDPNNGTPGYVPGWTAKGHPGYSGYAWYRIRVKVDGFAGGKLALAGSDDVDDGFQVFANGSLLGSFGDFSTSHPTVYYSQPTLFSIPPSARDTAAEGTEVFAFRFWMEPVTLQYTIDAGGFHTAPLLGQAAAVSADYQVRWLRQVPLWAITTVETLFYCLLVVLAVSLSIFDRSDKVYYWIAAVYTVQACNLSVQAVGNFSQHISLSTAELLVEPFFYPLILGAWVMVWWAWFRLRRPAWLPKAVVTLTLIYMLSQFLGRQLVFGLVSQPVAAKFHLISVAARLGFLALLLLVVIFGVRQQGREGWVALPAVLMLDAAEFAPELAAMHVRTVWFPFGIRFQLGNVAQLVLAIALVLLLLRRMFLSLRRQREQALDIKQAAEVQQVILPESRTVYPGLLIETEYRAAKQIGGDFFQIIPHAGDGSTLIVAGDVTGKGLQAGMTVALLIGAIRSTAELNSDPLVVLEALNRRLIGRDSSQATCLALSIAADGSCTLANAGHLPPYLNGKPVDMEGALPLGMIDGAEFSVMHFTLATNDKLVMVSDGILEATDANGKLFGFERVAELLRNSTPVKALADAAQKFGQEDDISLVAVTRTA